MGKPNLPWIPMDDNEVPGRAHAAPKSTPNRTVSRVERRRSIHGSVRSRSFDGRLDLETLPEEREEEVEAAEKEEETRHKEDIAVVRLREPSPVKPSVSEHRRECFSVCGSSPATRGKVRSIARHLSERQRERNRETRPENARNSMPDFKAFQKLEASRAASVTPSSANSTGHRSSNASDPSKLLPRAPSQFYAGRFVPHGSLMVYDPMHLANAYRGSYQQHPEYSNPVWYPLPAPPPVFVPLGPPVIQTHPQKLYDYEDQSSGCRDVCCAGVAQLLWTVISIVLVGIIAALLLTLFVV